MFIVPSAKARMNSSQNECLWHAIDIGNMFGPTIDFEKFIRNKITEKLVVLLISIFLHGKIKIAHPFTSPNLAPNLSSDQFMGASTLTLYEVA